MSSYEVPLNTVEYETKFMFACELMKIKLSHHYWCPNSKAAKSHMLNRCPYGVKLMFSLFWLWICF